MSSLPVIKQNVLTFKRLRSVNVIGYDIIANETLSDGSLNTRIVETLTNPILPVFVQYTEILPYNGSYIWNLSEDACTDDDHKVKVTLNGVELTGVHMTYSDKLRKLTLTLERKLTEADIVEVTYWKDEIEYIHVTELETSYVVKPKINYAYNMGYHNILR